MASTRALQVFHRRYLVTPNTPNIYLLCCFKLRLPNVNQKLYYCTKDSKRSVIKSDNDGRENKVQVSFGEVVKENTKSAGYLGVIVAGIGVTVYIFYSIFNELFSRNSPHGIYSEAFERCLKNTKLVDALGAPVKAYGEESRRGRRSRVGHSIFYKDGVEHMRMQFYIQGVRKQGTVMLEVQKNESGDYEFKYIYVKLNDVVGTIIKLEDNREKSKSLDQYTEPEIEFN